jgi:hypothetical protein
MFTADYIYSMQAQYFRNTHGVTREGSSPQKLARSISEGVINSNRDDRLRVIAKLSQTRPFMSQKGPSELILTTPLSEPCTPDVTLRPMPSSHLLSPASSTSVIEKLFGWHPPGSRGSPLLPLPDQLDQAAPELRWVWEAARASSRSWDPLPKGVHESGATSLMTLEEVDHDAPCDHVA